MVTVALSPEGEDSIEALLSRVPCIGEEVLVDGRVYGVLGVLHYPAGPDWDAVLKVEFRYEVPDDSGPLHLVR